jgi:hypothetical protein
MSPDLIAPLADRVRDQGCPISPRARSSGPARAQDGPGHRSREPRSLARARGMGSIPPEIGSPALPLT